MAITTIENLTEKTSAVGTDDMLLIAEKNGDTYTTKKINANAVGGGGSGAGDFVVDFSIDMPNVTSETTFAQISSAYQQGKNIKGIGTIEGMGDIIFNLSQISDSDAVFLGFIEPTAGNGVMATIRGTSSGYSIYVYQ